MMWNRTGVGLLLFGATLDLANCSTLGGDRQSALVGEWAQSHDECGLAAPILELKFRADGYYSVTWMPFESYEDYRRERYGPR